MKTANFATYHIRKWYSFVEETLANETGQLADGEPLFKYAIAAVIANPYAGRYSESLAELVDPSPLLGEEFGRRIQALAGAHEIVSYGKAILVGSAGEYEHGNAFLTNPAADPIRVALGGWQVVGAVHRQARRTRFDHRRTAGTQGCALRAFPLRQHVADVRRWPRAG